MADTAALAGHDDHAHGTSHTRTYVQIGVILAVLTALEVFAYEASHNPGTYGALSGLIAPVFVPLLLVLSVAKFALVGLYYMHLKDDSNLLSWVFIFSLGIALVVVFGLMVLTGYLYNHGMPPLVR